MHSFTLRYFCLYGLTTQLLLVPALQVEWAELGTGCCEHGSHCGCLLVGPFSPPLLKTVFYLVHRGSIFDTLGSFYSLTGHSLVEIPDYLRLTNEWVCYRVTNQHRIENQILGAVSAKTQPKWRGVS